MTGAVITPVQLTGTVEMSDGQTSSPSLGNSGRISVVIDRLLVHLRSGSRNDNEFFDLCLLLARSVDYAVANNELPGRAPDLPYLSKQVCQWRNDTLLRAATMVLMLSIKNACRNGWFSEKDSEEVLILSNEIASSFCSGRDMNCDESKFRPNITTVMSRFYPKMKMDEILTFVEATPGHGAYVKDFHISKNAKAFPDDKIYLFVAETDNIETSSCIVSPQQVNFLLNGKAVDGRTYANKDSGPQIPTHVTHMLKYGTNLLQAVGQFTGNYIIVVAFMGIVSNPSCPALPDYVPPSVASAESDNEIIEGPSTISLNCPISFTRIMTPVKGHLCKHLQCFDFDNYLDINSRRPSWRCPHCSQSVCLHDIRIDQSIVKVLKEVGANISHVRISGDGSWEAVTETGDHTDKPTPSRQEFATFHDPGVNILDLTEEDTDMDVTNACQDNNEIKPPPTQFQTQANMNNNQVPSFMNMNNVHRNTPPHMQDGFWNIQLPTHATAQSQSQSQNLPDTFISHGQSQILASNNMQFQQNYNSNDTSTECGVYPTMGGHTSRNTVYVQAISTQASEAIVDVDRNMQFTTFNLNPYQVSLTTSTPPSHHMGSQNWGHQDHSHIPSQPVQQFGQRWAPPQQTSGYAYHYTSSRQSNHFNSHPQQSLNHRVPQPVWSPEVHQAGVGPAPGPYCSLPAVQWAVQRESSMPVASMGEQRGQGQRVLEDSADAPADQNWCPAGRMRGSLSGRAYPEALNRCIIRPTQPVQAARPPVLNTPRPAIPPHLQALMAYRNMHGSQDR